MAKATLKKRNCTHAVDVDKCYLPWKENEPHPVTPKECNQNCPDYWRNDAR